MEHQLVFTRFLNTVAGHWVTQLLLALHYRPENPNAPITNAFAMELLCFAFLMVLFLIVRASISYEKPGSAQHLAEMYVEFVDNQGESIVGHGFERFMPFAGALAIFILVCNLLGLIPGFESPTATETTTLALAVCTFLYYNWHGIRAQGPIGYMKHFLGPLWWVAPLLLPIEIISHFARILSLSVRLYANMFAGDMVTVIFFSLIPIGVPIIFLAFHIFVSLIQAFVFFLLALIYLAGAVQHEDEVAV